MIVTFCNLFIFATNVTCLALNTYFDDEAFIINGCLKAFWVYLWRWYRNTYLNRIFVVNVNKSLKMFYNDEYLGQFSNPSPPIFSEFKKLLRKYYFFWTTQPNFGMGFCLLFETLTHLFFYTCFSSIKEI